ncbi:uncharacterized protein GGS22DRAFT_158000 [Annulohypoxylon maeteangense]|uniref:uncharacterized protein n=1 Tax=Annulohypoxylon maeteangense TaxID=1927788 RepID=UPI002007F2E4|nr:uncharacterized protein GGS22DRAFT_158000 [Annulohypoxylon maeteangense]KAI0886498.1 hypothetical protein GGS22DRAFT_158000 [Annulohypoxylon maeteangense]
MRRFQFLTRRLRRSGSSTFSVQSEYTARRRRDSKERRLLARESIDMWPSSGEESPLFNTPESTIIHADTPRAPGHHFDPLAMASMMIATAELDRLSSRASIERTSRTSGSSTGFSTSTPISPTPLHSGVGSPNDETSISESPELYSPPTIPYNTPTSSGLHSGVISPLSRTPHRQGHRRRAQRSHLSEVTTPEESTKEFSESRGSISSSVIETLPECSAILDDGREDNLYPEPLVIYRNSQEETRSTDNTTSGDTRDSHLGLKRGGAISAPARVSSIGKTLESMYDLKETSRDDGKSLPSVSYGPRHTIESPTNFPNLTIPVIVIETCDDQEQGSSSNSANALPGLDSGISQAATRNGSSQSTGPNSCHPDTWSESQGEPGDSDPFCPSDCLRIRCSVHVSGSPPPGPVRRDTSETICKVVVAKEGGPDGRTGLQETEQRKG